MREEKKQKVLFDAQAIIDLHTWGLWNRVIIGCAACVSSIIRKEAFFHSGNQAINLQPKIDAGEIQVKVATIEELDLFRSLLSDAFLFGIDDGEEEVLALLVGRKREKSFFYTADAQAIKRLGVLGLRDRGISVEALLKTRRIKHNLPFSRKDKYFKTYLDQGFMESSLYKRS